MHSLSQKTRIENVQNLQNLELHKYRGFMHPSWPFWSFSKIRLRENRKIFLKHIFDLKVCFYYEAIVVYVRFQVVHHRFTGSKQGSRLSILGSKQKISKMHKYSRLPILGSQTPVSSPSSIIISCYATREGIFTTMEVKY